MIYRLKYAKSESNFDADFEHPTQNRGCGAKNRGCRAKNRGFGHSPKGRIPCGCTSLNPTKSTTKKVDENRIYYPF
jgi:hypothetical protein